MRRLLFSWFIWLLLETMLLPMVVAFSPVRTRFLPSSYTILAFAQPSMDPDDGFSEQTPSISTVFNLECASQSKRILAPLRTVFVFSEERARARSIRLVSALIFFPSTVFFPRKLSSSVEEDPFIS